MKIKAFTMAEAILVMTILGIIATVMITTLKPATYKEEALKILADKVLGEIDIATSQILLNDSIDGTMDHLLTADTRKGFNVDGAIDKNDTVPDPREALTQLYKKYLVTKRGGTSYKNELALKDGAYMSIFFKGGGSSTTIYPGETTKIDAELPYGAMVIDINGRKAPPNVIGKDVFRVAFGKYGIDYDPKPSSTNP